jgi:hypothetical protein
MAIRKLGGIGSITPQSTQSYYASVRGRLKVWDSSLKRIERNLGPLPNLTLRSYLKRCDEISAEAQVILVSFKKIVDAKLGRNPLWELTTQIKSLGLRLKAAREQIGKIRSEVLKPRGRKSAAITEIPELHENDDQVGMRRDEAAEIDGFNRSFRTLEDFPFILKER